MIICTMYLQFDLPDVHSLKGRRAILNSLKERLKSFNVSVLDISAEYPKEASIAVAFLSPDAIQAAQYRSRIETMIETRFPEHPCEIDFEEF
ncbi:MAG: DUF503 domain-containing protein [Campylobacterales bacterium]|nr:DUF503 domain-containing protein [Campylobacterales bacterium]